MLVSSFLSHRHDCSLELFAHPIGHLCTTATCMDLEQTGKSLFTKGSSKIKVSRTFPIVESVMHVLCTRLTNQAAHLMIVDWP